MRARAWPEGITLTVSIFAATWHLFWTRPDWADRFFVEPLESRYQRASISSPDSFTLRLLLKGAASTFAKAQIALAKVAITYSGWRRPLKVAGCLAAVTVVSFLYFAGLIDLKSVQGFQTALLATP